MQLLKMEKMTALEVYLSGEIHTDWREKIQSGASDLNHQLNFIRQLPTMIAVMTAVLILGHENALLERS